MQTSPIERRSGQEIAQLVAFIRKLGYLPNAQGGSVADEARLLYVVMMRAIEVLVLTSNRRAEFVEPLTGVAGEDEVAALGSFRWLFFQWGLLKCGQGGVDG